MAAPFFFRHQRMSGVGSGRISQFVAVAVDFEDDAERVFDIDHAIGFLARKIFADRHALLAASRHDLFDQTFHVRILNAEMEGAAALVIEALVRRVIIRKFKNFDTDPVYRARWAIFNRFQSGPETSLHMTPTAVAAGQGYTILPRSGVIAFAHADRLSITELGRPSSLPLRAIYQKGRMEVPRFAKLMQLVKAHAARLDMAGTRPSSI